MYGAHLRMSCAVVLWSYSVAAERCEDVGRTVGYQIRLESSRSVQTQMLFCTTGIVLRRVTDDPLLKGISHLIIGTASPAAHMVQGRYPLRADGCVWLCGCVCGCVLARWLQMRCMNGTGSATSCSSSSRMCCRFVNQTIRHVVCRHLRHT